MDKAEMMFSRFYLLPVTPEIAIMHRLTLVIQERQQSKEEHQQGPLHCGMVVDNRG